MCQNWTKYLYIGFYVLLGLFGFLATIIKEYCKQKAKRKQEEEAKKEDEYRLLGDPSSSDGEKIVEKAGVALSPPKSKSVKEILIEDRILVILDN